ncbi:MAG: DUF4129 domain-containing protein, partial [Candidatus Hodarchaeota archaeon]
ATLTIFYRNGGVTTPYPTTTNATGGYSFPYNFSLADTLGGIYIWGRYMSSDPLWSNAQTANRTATLILYATQFNMVMPSNVYLDQGVVIQGTLTYEGGAPALVGETVNIYVATSAGGPYSFIGSRVTNGLGGFSLTYSFTVPPDTEGSYYFLCTYTASSPLDADASTGPMEVIAERYLVQLEIFVNPNPVHQNETIIITAHLYFDINGTDISGMPVELWWYNGSYTLLDSIPDLTNSSGWIEFIYSGMDYDTIRSGIEIFAYFDGSAFLLDIESSHESFDLLQWQTTIVGFSTDAASYYLLETMQIFGWLEYDLSPSPNEAIGGVWVDILLDGLLIGSALTDSTGYFYLNWPIDETNTPGTHEITAHYSSGANWITDHTTSPTTVTFLQYNPEVTAYNDVAVVYLGGSITIYGTLQFVNGTPMVGYDVEIYWNNGTEYLLATLTVTEPTIGFYSYIHAVGWNDDVGVCQYYVKFVRPDASFEEEESTPTDVEVHDVIQFTLDTQSVTMVVRGDTIDITGYVSNGAGRAAFVPVQILANGTSIGTTTSDDNGRISVSLIVPDTASRGVHNISLGPDSQFYELLGPSDYWLIELHIDSVIEVDMPEFIDLLPGESVVVTIQLTDIDGFPIPDATIRIYLNSTQVLVRVMTSTDWPYVRVTVPTGWSQEGMYVLSVEYDGDPSQFYEGSSSVSEYALHIFTSVEFSFAGTPARVNPGTAFTVQCVLQDGLGLPIRSRFVEFDLNGTSSGQLATDATGFVSVAIPGIAQEGNFTVSVTLLSTQLSNIVSPEYIIEIELVTTGPFDLMDLVLPFIVIGAAIIAVILYMYFVRGFGREGFVSVARDIASKLRNIKKLADAGKFSAAISLIYRTFEDICGKTTGTPRHYSETAREFVDRVISDLPLTRGEVDYLLLAYEEARFSDHELSQERYEDTMRAFNDIYPRIEAVIAMD